MSEIYNGMTMGHTEWLALNTRLVFEHPELLDQVAPFPPPDLMRNVSGLTVNSDFAAHGGVFYTALQKASPIDISQYRSILDFGCGCGRLARYFKGHPGVVTGCDIDPSHVDWINQNLPYMRAKLTQPNEKLPFHNGQFDCVISISVFTHMDEASQFFYLSELARCTASGAHLFLTTHGARAMERAMREDRIFKMLEVPHDELEAAKNRLSADRYAFILQNGHLTSSDYAYGITFLSAEYVVREWSAYFDIIDVVSGAIHDFQDIVVCRKK